MAEDSNMERRASSNLMRRERDKSFRIGNAHSSAENSDSQATVETELSQEFGGSGDGTDNCKLPEGARWCTARSGKLSWKMAVYAGPDPVSSAICSTGGWEH